MAHVNDLPYDNSASQYAYGFRPPWKGGTRFPSQFMFILFSEKTAAGKLLHPIQ
jgi:hypothetical protein